jgi:hypothetical protein
MKPTNPNKYENAFHRLYKKQTPAVQAKIDAAKGDPDTKDKDVAKFVKQVCELAENGIITTE